MHSRPFAEPFLRTVMTGRLPAPGLLTDSPLSAPGERRSSMRLYPSVCSGYTKCWRDMRFDNRTSSPVPARLEFTTRFEAASIDLRLVRCARRGTHSFLCRLLFHGALHLTRPELTLPSDTCTLMLPLAPPFSHALRVSQGRVGAVYQPRTRTLSRHSALRTWCTAPSPPSSPPPPPSRHIVPCIRSASHTPPGNM